MNRLLEHKFLAPALIVLLSSLSFIPLLGNCHLFDWDEVNFAECAREMIVSGDYSHVQLNYRPFWEKPPLFIWMQALCMQLFGINEFAARFPNALCSVFTYLSLYYAGRRLVSARTGMLWVLLYFGSLLPHLYFKTGIIDPWFNLFIFQAVLQFFLFSREGKLWRAIVAGACLGLAVLTKGPAALLIVALCIPAYLIWTKNLRLLLRKGFWLFVFSTLLVAGSWFLTEWAKGNGSIILEFIEYQVRLAGTKDAGHGGPFYFHFIVLLLGCFPASVFFVQSLLKKNDWPPEQLEFRRLMLSLFFTVLLVFSFAVETKIVHYSSLCYFPLTFVAAQFLSGPRFSLNKTLFFFCSGLITLATLIIGSAKWLLPAVVGRGWIKDSFVLGNLQAEVHWSGFEWLLAVPLIAGSAFIYAGSKNNFLAQVAAGLALSGLFTGLTINVIAPKAEAYTQGAAIAFYKSCAKQSCYIETHGFKSYAYLFYSDRKPSDYWNPEQKAYISRNLDLMEQAGHSRITSYAVSNQLWMEYGKIDRPAYLVVKKPQEHEEAQIPGCSKLYEQNGFVFFVRRPF